jgi:hypothetical protein
MNQYTLGKLVSLFVYSVAPISGLLQKQQTSTGTSMRHHPLIQTENPS